MTCQELVELITDYLEGSMQPDERLHFEEHLGLCRGCVNYVDQMRVTIEAVGSLREDAVSPEAREALLTAFRDWKQS